MSALRRLQQAFFDGVRANDPARFPPSTSTPTFTASQRAAVYIDAYRLRLAEALQDSYPTLHVLLGDDAFFQLADAYIDAHPSRHFSIRYFGDRLAAFLRGQHHYQQQPVVAEMAHFEWLFREVFDAPDGQAACIADLEQLSPEQWGELRFRSDPTLRRIDLKWNVPALWLAVDAEESPRAPECQPEAISWVIWRQDLRSHFESVSQDEMQAFDLLVGGASFGELCDALAGALGEEQAPWHAAEFLAKWLSRGWLVRGAG